VNTPTPAIVAQGAVKRLPRLALLLFCLAYVLPGFIGRVPWKRADISTFGYIAELARGSTDWLAPTLGGLPPEVDALLPYWLGALAIQFSPSWIAVDFAARLPFVMMLVLSLIATWYGTYYLARSPEAQPVAFAFGGEALPKDYARAVADGGLLAFIACLGLAQLSHETTPALAQLCFTALLFYAVAALPYRQLVPGIAASVGILGLSLSGAPSMATFLGLGCTLIYLMDATSEPSGIRQNKLSASGLLALTLSAAWMANQFNLWRWRIELPQTDWEEWKSLGRLFLWFTWPTWPLAIWTLWRWRLQLIGHGQTSRHLWLPLWFLVVSTVATLITNSADRSLLLALPALAALAAFALPTLGRSLGALIDWFTLIFFSSCALVIWIVWISMQTGFPSQPAMNVARLAPGFEHSFSFITFLIAVCATGTWAWLVKWRIGRHRAAIWKCVVLPAGGSALCWLLLMTLWLPLLDFARSYAPLVKQTMAVMQARPNCVASLNLDRSQIAAFQFHGDLILKPLEVNSNCSWMIAKDQGADSLAINMQTTKWYLRGDVNHPSDKNEHLLLYARQPN
jgi:4-amino-4-deoxy-L-arabinose transferase-like glycosyltransferase